MIWKITALGKKVKSKVLVAKLIFEKYYLHIRYLRQYNGRCRVPASPLTIHVVAYVDQ